MKHATPPPATSPLPAGWRVRPPAPADYVAAVSSSPLVAQLLYNRGVSPADVPSFLNPDAFKAADPFALPDVGTAVNRILVAIRKGETIGVFGDFDVDGVTASAVLIEGMERLGARTVQYIPDRVGEGHGLSAAGVADMHDRGASLVVTCDCGISDLAEAEKSSALGVDLIITDHHVPLATLPRAVAVVNAKRRDSRYGFTEFAGVGIAFKLMQALYQGWNDASRLDELLELVALGTVADMVALVGENRHFVQKGLEVLNRTARPGLQALISTSGLTAGSVTSGDISWALAPRINSAGRLENASMSLQLLMTSSVDEAATLASDLDATNAERQRLTAEVYEMAHAQLASQPACALLMAADESYPEGVIGLVAGKLSKEYYRPAVVVTTGEDLCRGSSRSIPEFDLAWALEQCKDLLNSFGGHPLAAGFSVTKDRLPLLEERLKSLAESRLAGVEAGPRIDIDAEGSLKSLGGDT
ncbi:MAG: single-stranded-DNA-specific exonuclease RecJ, partial [Dehalococcoidia bacterium]|nr:single-stranded-DNA-specific exonuclease RecJ [Dehalococcoidia bacterium]